MCVTKISGFCFFETFLILENSKKMVNAKWDSMNFFSALFGIFHTTDNAKLSKFQQIVCILSPSEKKEKKPLTQSAFY